LKIICIDNEKYALDILVRAVHEAAPDAELRSYSRAMDMLAEVRQSFVPDVVFADIEMPGMTGLDLAVELKKISGDVNIIFVTGYSDYAYEAMRVRPSGYVMKPVTGEKVQVELNNLRYPPERAVKTRKIQVHCFGNFDVFVDEKPMIFLRSKSKELLAYLIDRKGSGVERAEMAAVLWEDMPYDRSIQKQLNVIRSDLLKSLEDAGALGMIVQSRNSLAVDPKAFDCDYYQALSGDVMAFNDFHGEYMAQYSWAEFTTGLL
jgi:two-component system LytT family response regulator